MTKKQNFLVFVSLVLLPTLSSATLCEIFVTQPKIIFDRRWLDQMPARGDRLDLIAGTETQTPHPRLRKPGSPRYENPYEWDPFIEGNLGYWERRAYSRQEITEMSKWKYILSNKATTVTRNSSGTVEIFVGLDRGAVAADFLKFTEGESTQVRLNQVLYGVTKNRWFSYVRRDSLPEHRAWLIDRLIRDSTKPDNLIEIGMVIVEYRDGTFMGVKYTDRQPNYLSFETHDRALQESGILEGDVVSYLHIHTHPGGSKDRTSYLPSFPDYVGYQRMLRKDVPVGAKFEGLIVPRYEGFEDLVIRITREDVKKSTGL